MINLASDSEWAGGIANSRGRIGECAGHEAHTCPAPVASAEEAIAARSRHCNSDEEEGECREEQHADHINAADAR